MYPGGSNIFIIGNPAQLQRLLRPAAFAGHGGTVVRTGPRRHGARVHVPCRRVRVTGPGGGPARLRASLAAMAAVAELEFFTWDTPNGKKVSICLAEMGLAHTTRPVNIGTNTEQFEPAFLAVSPNGKIPGTPPSPPKNTHTHTHPHTE